MISQSTVLPTTTPLTPGSVPAQPAVASGQWSGVGTAIRSGVLPFLQSLHPGYLPTGSQPPEQWVETPAFAMGRGNGQGSGFLQGTELAARLVSAYAALPTEIGRLLGGLVSLSATARFAGNQLGAAGATTGSVPERGMDNSSPDSLLVNNKRKIKKEQQNSQQAVSDGVATGKATHPANTLSGAAVATLSLMAMDQLTGAAAAPSAGEPGSPENPIPVGDSATLGKIGQPDYPRDAYYRQIDSFHHNSRESIGGGDSPFTGHYDGGCHTISGPERCLFQNLSGNAEVHDLRVTHAFISNSDQYSAALACEMEANSMVRNVRVEDSSIINTADCTRKKDPWCHTGVIAGRQESESQIKDAEVHNSSVTTHGGHSYAGIGCGDTAGDIQSLTVSESKVCAEGSDSFAGIGGGMVRGHINNLTVVKCQVTTLGKAGHAGIGAGGFGVVLPYPSNYTSLDGSINRLVAVDSHVKTGGDQAHAGIGAGYVRDEISKTTAINCSVTATGTNGSAGIGAGYITEEGRVKSTRAVDCNVTTTHGDPAGIGAGYAKTGSILKDTRSLNSRVNAELRNEGNLTLPGLCSTADPHLVTSDCQLNPVALTENHWNCSATPFVPIPEAPVVLPGTLLPPTPVGLSTGAITGISLGAAAFVLAGVAGGVCIYRHYHRGPSPAVTGNQQELGSLDSAAILNNTGSFASDDL